MDLLCATCCPKWEGAIASFPFADIWDSALAVRRVDFPACKQRFAFRKLGMLALCIVFRFCLDSLHTTKSHAFKYELPWYC